MILPRKGIATFLLAALLAGYAATYVVLTRQAMLRSKEHGLIGYFFVYPPEDTQEWRAAERPYRLLFMPLILLEYYLGSKVFPGNPPCSGFK